jgi:hypothetical protein
MKAWFTLREMLWITALVASVAGVARVGGRNGVLSFLSALAGICILIRSDWSETVRERIALILAGLALLAFAALRLLLPAIR